MKRILYCGDVGCQTGFGRVAEYLIPALAEQHEVHALAVNWHGDPSPMQQQCRMYPAMAHGSDPFGSHRIAELVQVIKPDLVWVTNDFWIAINLWEQIKPFKEKLALSFSATRQSTPMASTHKSFLQQWNGMVLPLIQSLGPKS